MAKKIRLYVGTYTVPLSFVSGSGKGIYTAVFDQDSGEISDVKLAAYDISNPSYLTIAPGRRCLYAVQETVGGRTPAVYAYRMDARGGALQYLNHQPAHGGAPCHLTLDKNEKHVISAHYVTGSVAVHPILPDGRLEPATDIAHHEGKGANPERQESPHAHIARFDPSGRFLFVADLGIDKVIIYRYDGEKGRLYPHEQPFAAVQPGAGPRHLAFHPSGSHAFVINELDSTVSVFSHRDGRLKHQQTISTLPDADPHAPYSCAAIRVSANGKYVYGSNRGHDSIAIFAFDAASGKLKAIGHEPTGGKTPRELNLDPSGRWLLAGNQDSDTITTFRINPANGLLKSNGISTPMPNPVCLAFVEM